MPKGRGKGKNAERYAMYKQDYDVEDSLDSASVFSWDTMSVMSQWEECDEESTPDEIEENLLHIMDQLNQKSWQGRVGCLNFILQTLCRRYSPSLLSDRVYSLCDDIGRFFKKGYAVERIVACRLASMICIQLGAESSCEVVCNLLQPSLMKIAADNSVDATVRGECCSTLAIFNFVAQSEMRDNLSLMRQFEGYFSGSLSEDGKAKKVCGDDYIELYASALSAWGLLLTTIPPGTASMMMETKSLISIKKLIALLESPHLEIRLATGDVIALLYEIAKLKPDGLGEDYHDMMANLRSLSKDCHKYIAKKGRKQQKNSFRDIVLYIEENVISVSRVKNGRETLELDSWTKKKHYGTICSVLGPGINSHLRENDFLRAVFEVFRTPVPVDASENPLVLTEKEKDDLREMYRIRDKKRCKNLRNVRNKRVPEF